MVLLAELAGYKKKKYHLFLGMVICPTFTVGFLVKGRGTRCEEGVNERREWLL